MKKYIVYIKWYDNDYNGKVQLVKICDNKDMAYKTMDEERVVLSDEWFEITDYELVIQDIELEENVENIRLFYDDNNDEVITLEKLKSDYEKLKEKHRIKYTTFDDYLSACMDNDNDGSLVELI